ncbi:acyl-CoA carboxylase subunit epsilon [Microbacterium horticulturae]|uniref:Acyl-CoA carboxylase subunit epsilon n=1 Tax=Microbacterium horticulturae TaxID=3028316 RepID=A0ABY8BZT1_9MICO|nr:acyl-CoA carboxylase subunit epsilon [Microbacterium sp. KACC 23027]WEG07923.1 acyl-CoA carboxylase subunit epsilon [Microbacterium sp. KACC 23027]
MTSGDVTGAPPQIDVVRGNPTDVELAALIAVVSEAYAREEESATATECGRRSPWEISSRSLRRPLRRELGWRNFTA